MPDIYQDLLAQLATDDWTGQVNQNTDPDLAALLVLRRLHEVAMTLIDERIEAGKPGFVQRRTEFLERCAAEDATT